MLYWATALPTVRNICACEGKRGKVGEISNLISVDTLLLDEKWALFVSYFLFWTVVKEDGWHLHLVVEH